MQTKRSTQFGWRDATPTYSQSYLEPKVLALLRRYGAKSVLDLGCGNGVMLRRLAETGFAAVGCEPDFAGCTIARASTTAKVYQLGVEDETDAIAESPFDAVISTEVIEHLYDPAKLFKFAHRVLRPDGHLLVSTPYHGYWKNLALSLADKWDFHHHPERVGGHVKFWSRNTLAAMFRASGFVVEKFEGAGRVPWLWNSMIIVGRKSPEAGPVS